VCSSDLLCYVPYVYCYMNIEMDGSIYKYVLLLTLDHL